MAKRPGNASVSVQISTERYYQTLAETFEALDAAGAGYLKRHAIAFSGVESGFGNPALFRQERSQPDRYIGVFQLGDEHSRYLARTPEADQLRAIGVMQGVPTPGRVPYDPYKNQGVLGAAALMHYANIAREVTGKSEADLTSRDLWTLHLFGQNGGKALLEGAHANPNMKLSELTFRYNGHDIPAVRRAAFNGNIGPSIKGVNSEGISYDKVTVGQAFDLIQRHFDRRAVDLPAHLDSEYRREFLTAARTEQPHANPEQPERELAELQRIEQLQQQRIADARRRTGGGDRANPPDADHPASPAASVAQARLSREEISRVQQVLIASGFGEGLGSSQADGVMGRRTRDTLDIYNKATKTDLVALVKEGKAEELIAAAGTKSPRKYTVVAASDVPKAVEEEQKPAQQKEEPPATVAHADTPAKAPQEQAAIAEAATKTPQESPLELPPLSQEASRERRYIANAQKLLGIDASKREGYLDKHDLGAGASRSGELAVLSLDVKRIQQALLDAGEALPKFGADGNAGQETYDALLSYRSKNGHDLPQLVQARQEMAALDDRTQGLTHVPLPPEKPRELKGAALQQGLPVTDVAENGPPIPTPQEAVLRQHSRS